jgi:hypothetical protein
MADGDHTPKRNCPVTEYHDDYVSPAGNRCLDANDMPSTGEQWLLYIGEAVDHVLPGETETHILLKFVRDTTNDRSVNPIEFRRRATEKENGAPTGHERRNGGGEVGSIECWRLHGSFDSLDGVARGLGVRHGLSGLLAYPRICAFLCFGSDRATLDSIAAV